MKMALRLLSRKRNGPQTRQQRRTAKHTAAQAPPYESAEPLTFEQDLLRRDLQLERYGIIVANRNRWKTHPDGETIYRSALQAIDERFALVPEGFVSLPQTVIDAPGCPEVDVETQPFLLSRYNVTNRQYQKFVDDDSYANLELWDEDTWPHLIDFKDPTGYPAPRFWQNGRHNQPLADHPVVGICSYEALAYARWAGFRLPTEAEWQMAASWRVRTAAHVLRRYPWGDALDTQRCNIWASNIGTTVPVDAYESGQAPNGVYQLIGNVWEWTSSEFNVTDDEGNRVVGDMLMKAIRGGAFDTYFSAQATSLFRTGLASLARCHNIGFRCVLDLGDRSQ